jgi:hypothetical protein
MIERDIQQDKTVRRHMDRADGRDPHDVTRRQQQSEPSV